MALTQLGDTGVEVPHVCFGTSVLGDMPDTYGYGVDDTRARETLDAIFDGPMNFLDTSNNYGFGQSEQRIGAAIRDRGGLPDGFILSTKLDRDMETGRFDAARVRQSIEESLTRLGLDNVALLHLHDPEYARDLAEITRDGGAIDELFKLKEDGIAQAVGLAMGRLDVMAPILAAYPFDALISHNRWTVVNQSADTLFNDAHARGIAILNAAPYAGGVLAKGSIEMPQVTYQPGTDETLAPVRAVEAICTEHGVAPGAVALQFSMRDPRVTSTIVGVSKPERVIQTIGWAQAKIPDAVWDALATLTPSLEDPEANRVYTPG
ncbi:MAG: aldo/keto reductase [Pseudomonadota bacterium]